MICPAVLALLLGAAGAQAPQQEVELAFADVIVRERVIIRIPVPRQTPAPMTQWKERRGPRCIKLGSIGGAAVTGSASVDMILRGGDRIRAELESACPALDFYSGFYLNRSKDGRICADRDSVHARSGGECQIERFRKLVPVRH